MESINMVAFNFIQEMKRNAVLMAPDANNNNLKVVSFLKVTTS